MGLSQAKVKAERERNRLTMEQAAALMGWKKRQKWFAFESGAHEPHLGTLLKAASALRCSISDLVDEEYPPQRKRK